MTADVGEIRPADNRARVGVVGGVGPLATTYYLEKIIRLTHAERDQDHVDLVVMQHSSIPDRTAFILGESTEDPGPVLAADARQLEGIGVDFITMPCNTAHYFVQQVIDSVEIPVVSIVHETVEQVRRTHPGAQTVGILATSGTLAAKVYQDALEPLGLSSVVPDAAHQAVVTSLIYDDVKAGRQIDLGRFTTVVDHLVEQGAEAVILGCTELSVIADDFQLLENPLYVDSLDVLARVTIERSGHQLKA